MFEPKGRVKLTKQVNVRVSEEEYAVLRRAASSQGVGVTDIVRACLQVGISASREQILECTAELDQEVGHEG
jgi:uncharacterized protein (DUF1778 family)